MAPKMTGHTAEKPRMTMSKDIAATIQHAVSIPSVLRPRRITESKMSAEAAALMPTNTRFTYTLSSNPRSASKMRMMVINEGSTVPKTAATEPIKPALRCPTNMLTFTAMTPGNVCASSTSSRISSAEIHFFLFTNSSSIKGIIAKPPPKVKRPILKNELKSLKKSLITYLCFISRSLSTISAMFGLCLLLSKYAYACRVRLGADAVYMFCCCQSCNLRLSMHTSSGNSLLLVSMLILRPYTSPRVVRSNVSQAEQR